MQLLWLLLATGRSQISQVNAVVHTEHSRHQHLHLILILILSELSTACNRVPELHQDLEAFSILPLQCVPLSVGSPSNLTTSSPLPPPKPAPSNVHVFQATILDLLFSLDTYTTYNLIN